MNSVNGVDCNAYVHMRLGKGSPETCGVTGLRGPSPEPKTPNPMQSQENSMQEINEVL